MRNPISRSTFVKSSLLAGACAALLTGCFVLDWKAAYTALGKSSTRSEQLLVDNDQLYIAGQSDVYHAFVAAYDTAGKQLWNFDPYDGVTAFSTGQGDDMMAVGPDGHLYYLINLFSSPSQSRVFVLSRQGELLDSWTASVGHDVGMQVGADGTLYIYAKSSGLLAAYAPNGALQWQHQAPPPVSVSATLTTIQLLDGSILFRADELVQLLSPAGEVLHTFTAENFALTDIYSIKAIDNVVWMTGKGATGLELVSLGAGFTELTRTTLYSPVMTTNVQIEERQGGLCVGISHMNNRFERFFRIVQTNEQGSAEWQRDIAMDENHFRYDDLVRAGGSECYVSTGWADEQEVSVNRIRRFLVDGKPADTITMKGYLLRDYSVVDGAVYQTGVVQAAGENFYPVTHRHHLQ